MCLGIFILTGLGINAQPTAGTTGLLNIPTAEMQRDGTFMFGANYLPNYITPQKIDYNTGNYYINITFLPFMEASYRCTLLQTKNTGNYNQQDRSVAIRARILKERKYLPSILFGGNDVYTSSEKGNQYFGALYVVTSKNFNYRKSVVGASLGYGLDAFRKNEIKGIFGGISFSPGFCNDLKLMAEYDSGAFNTGGSLTLFKHFSIVVFAYDLDYIAGGLVCKLNLQ